MGCEITNRSFKEITSSGTETGYPSEALEFTSPPFLVGFVVLTLLFPV